MDVEVLLVSVEGDDGMRVPVKVLSCDTISQAKEKLLDAIYKATPVSQRPALTSIDLGESHTHAPHTSSLSHTQKHQFHSYTHKHKSLIHILTYTHSLSLSLSLSLRVHQVSSRLPDLA